MSQSESDTVHMFMHLFCIPIDNNSLTKSEIGDEGVTIIAGGLLKHPDCALRRFWYVTFNSYAITRKYLLLNM